MHATIACHKGAGWLRRHVRPRGTPVWARTCAKGPGVPRPCTHMSDLPPVRLNSLYLTPPMWGITTLSHPFNSRTHDRAGLNFFLVSTTLSLLHSRWIWCIIQI